MDDNTKILDPFEMDDEKILEEMNRMQRELNEQLSNGRPTIQSSIEVL